jgi:NADH:ubiquinone oxidoreductase subunit 4 (subunit M)
MFTPVESTEAVRMNLSSKAVCLLLGVTIIALGVYPKPLQRLLTKAPVAEAATSPTH